MIEQYELRRNETQITIRDPFTLCLTFKKTVRIMENPTLPTNWLAAAKHLMVSLGGMARAAISLR